MSSWGRTAGHSRCRASFGWALLALVVGGLLLAAWLVYRVVERPLAGPLKRALNRSLEHIRTQGRPSAEHSRGLVQPRTQVEPERQPVICSRPTRPWSIR
jgi:peptidoglycan/LPS O-acetylase OafA/YrhL